MSDEYTDRAATIPMYEPGTVSKSTPLVPIASADDIPMYQPESSDKKMKQFKLSAEWYQPFQDVVDDIKQHYAAGERAVNDGAAGAAVLKGEKTYDEALKDLSTNEQPITNKTQVGQAVASAVEMLPTLKYIAEGAAQGAAGVGAAAAAGGAVYGLVGGPAAEVTVPAAAGAAGLWGAAVGGDAGAFTAAANIAAGQSYMTLRQQGVSDTTARVTAVGMGALNGALQSLQIGKLGSVATDAVKAEAESSKVLLGKAIKGYLDGLKVQVGLASAQKFAEQIGHTLAKVMDKGAAAIPTIDEVLKGAGDLWGTATQAAQAAAVTLPVAHAGGVVVGKMLKPVMPKEPTNIHEGAAAVHELTVGEVPDYAVEAKLAHTKYLAGKTALELEGRVTELETLLSETELQKQPSAAVETELKAARKALTRVTEKAYTEETKVIETDLLESAKRSADLAKQIDDLQEQMKQASTKEDVRKMGLLKEEMQAEKDLQKDLLNQVKTRQAKETKKANKALDTALKRLETTTGKRGKPASKFDLDTQRVMEHYQKFTKNRTPAAAEAHLRESAEIDLKRTKDVDEKALNDSMSPDITTASREIADIVASDTMIDYKNPMAVYRLADKINILAAIGHDNRMQAKLDQARMLAEVEDTVYKAINPPGKHQVDITEQRAKQLPKVTELQRIGGAPLMTWNVLMGHIFQHAEDPSKALAAVDPFPSLAKSLKNIQDQNKLATETMTGGNGELYDYAARLVKNGDKQKNWGQFTDQDGAIRDYNAKSWEVIQDIMDMRNATRGGKDSKMYAGLRNGNKFTFNDDAHNNFKLTGNEQSFEALLDDIQRTDPHMKDIVDGLMNYYNSDELYNRTNAVHVQEFAIDMPRVKDYTGFRRREGLFVGEEGSYQDTLINGPLANRPQSLVPSSTMKAVKSDKPYAKVDAYNNLSQFITANETWAAMRDTERILRHVFTSPRVRKAIEMKYGADTKKIIDNMYSSIVGTQGIQHAQRIKLISYVRQHVGPAFTYGKPVSIVKQMASVGQALHYIGADDFVSGMSEAVAHPIRAYKELSKTDWWESRYNNYVTELAERRAMQGVFGAKLDPKIIEATGHFLTAGDKVTAITMGWAVRQAKIKEALASGKTQAEAEAFGNMWAGKVVNETQSSAIADQITNFERGGDMNKMLTIFTKQPLQVGGQYALSVRRYIANPTTANRNTMVRTIAAAHIAQGVFVGVDAAIYLGIKAAFGNVQNKDTQEAINKVARGLIMPGTGLPVIGDIENMIATEATNKLTGVKEKAWSPSFLPYDMATRGAKFVVDTGNMAIKAVKGQAVTPKNIFTALDDYARGVAPLLPTTPISGQMPISPWIRYAKPFFVQKKKTKKDTLNPLI